MNYAKPKRKKSKVEGWWDVVGPMVNCLSWEVDCVQVRKQDVAERLVGWW